MAREYNMIYKRANGSSINITDGADNNLKDVTIYGNSVQDGTPTPSSSIPVNVVSGDNEINICGKNLVEGSQDFGGVWVNNNQWTTDTNTYNGLVVKKRTNAWNGIYKEINVESGKTYYFSLYSKSDTARSVAIYLSGGTATLSNSSSQFNTTTNWERYRIRFTCTASGTIRPRLENTSTISGNYTYICGYMLEEGESLSDYEPYIGNTYPVNLGVEELLDTSTYINSTTVNGITYTNNGDGTFSLSGTASANTSIGIVPIGSLSLEPNQPYYLYSSKAYNNNTFNMSIVMNENGTNRYLVANSTYTTPSTFTDTRLQFYIASGNTVDAQNVQMSLVKGTKYNHAKSTQIELAALNVYNLCDSSQTDGVVESGITYTRNSDGSITANGTATATSYIDLGGKIFPQGSYILSGCPLGGSDSKYKIILVNTNGWSAVANDYGSGATATLNGTDVYRVRIRIGSGTHLDNLTFYPQLEVGSTKHEYTPYGTPLPIYRDKLYSKGNKWYVHKEIGKVVLNGSENWILRNDISTANGFYTFRNDDYTAGQLITNSVGCSNYFEIVTTSTNAKNNIRLIDTIHYGTTICIDGNIAQNSTQLKTWLSEHKPVVYYILPTPTETEITDTELISQLNALSTIDGQNNITLLSSSSINTELDFYYNVNNSNEYFQALIDNTATIETIVNVLALSADEEIINLNEENSVINWTHSDFRYVQNTEDKSQEGFIGQFVARTFDGKVIDLDDDFNIENHEIEVYLGIVNEEDTGYISLGNFIIESIERDEVDDTTSFKSSDYTMFFNQKFNGDYTDGTFTDSFNTKIQNGETVTALWLAQYTCAQVGVVLGHSDFTNYDYVIASNQFDDQHTCRDVIKSIAKLAYSWARIGWDNKLYFDFTVDTEVNTNLNVITNENYYNLETQKEEIGEINKVILGSSIVSGNNQYIEDSASIEANGEHAIEIYDNPITYNDDTKIAALENGDVLYGLHYRPLSTLTTGHPWLQGNELIEIVDMEGNSIYTYPFDRTIEYNGHIKTKLDSYGATAVESTQSYYEGTDNIAKQTKVELDRQNQRLTVAISELNGEIQDVSDEFNKLAEPSHTVRGTEISVDDGGEFNFKNFGIYGQLQQGDLPVQYTPVEYITNNGNQCYINSYFPRISSHDSTSYYWGISKFYFKLAINDLTQGGYIYGNVHEYLEYSTTSGLEFHIQGADITLLNRNDIDTNVHTYFIDNINHKFVVDDGEEQTYETSSTGTSIMDRFIFNAKDYNDNIKTSPNINLYELKLYDIQNIINKDLVPVYNNKKEMYGLYNKITNEFFEANNPNLISGGNEIIPTYNSPIEIYPVKLDHTLNIQSKNLVDLENQMGKIGDYDINVENNTIILNGTSDTGGYQDFDQRYTYLDPGIYTLTCKFSGESGFEDEPGVALLFYGNNRRLADLGTDIVYDYFTGTYPEYYFTFEVSGDEASPFYFEVYTRANANYINYKIDLCIEKGGESTGVSRHVESQSYTYDLGTDTVENQLCSIGNYYDFINYNITDEKWYKTKAIACKPLSSFVEELRVSNDDYSVYGLSNTTLQHNNPFNILNKNIPCYSTHFKWGGSVSDDSEALSKGVGMYTGNHKWNTFISGILYVVVPKAWEQSLSGSFADWCDENNVNVYYVQEDPVTEELPDYDLVIQLDNILANAKLYDTDMIVSDTPLQDSSCPAELEVTYMFNTTFNGSYATRTELQVTQNSIQTVVADTVSTTLDPITLGLEDLGDRVDTVEGNLQGDIDSLRGELGDYALQTDVVTLERSVTELQTSTAEVISVAKDIQVNGVSKVRTSTDFTFDEEGLMIAKTGAATKTQVTENGMSIYSTAGSTDEAMLTVNSQGVDAYNVKVGTYLLIGTHARMQDYEDGTGVFYIG